MERQTVSRKPEFLREYTAAADSLKRKSALSRIVGQSRVVQELRNEIEKASSHDIDVLIYGETGTGKELGARSIHYLSNRAGKAFVPVNCGAIPESLFENELFGHIKGAFTDAYRDQIGLVKEAEHGTLFLDEIGVASPFVQVKLLRLLQNREYRPVGDCRRHKAHMRVIAATNRDLKSLLEDDKFRKDLFYRLNVVAIHMPPLRERKEDILLLVEHFQERYAREYGKPVRDLTREAIRRLLAYSWPGNIRQLEHEVQRAVVMSEDAEIGAGSFQFATSRSESQDSELENFNIAKKRTIDSFARNYLSQLLRQCGGNVVIAARFAGKSRTGLWNLLKRYEIQPSKFHSFGVRSNTEARTESRSSNRCVMKG